VIQTTIGERYALHELAHKIKRKGPENEVNDKQEPQRERIELSGDEAQVGGEEGCE
jgi:hypothetical protein